MHIEHNSANLIYRNPFGACRVNTCVTLRLCVESFSEPEKVILVIGENEIPMNYAFELSGRRMYECSVEMPSEEGLVFIAHR